MELTVAKVDLQRAAALCGVVEKRSTIPILSNVLLLPLTAAADRGDGSRRHDPYLLRGKVTTPGGVTIEAKRLFDVVRSLPDEDVRVAVQENNQMLRVRYCQVPALSCRPRYPSAANGGGVGVVHHPADELKTMVAKVRFAITHEKRDLAQRRAASKYSPRRWRWSPPMGIAWRSSTSRRAATVRKKVMS
jgi:DNA polymerase-3 subunit beta